MAKAERVKRRIRGIDKLRWSESKETCMIFLTCVTTDELAHVKLDCFDMESDMSKDMFRCMLADAFVLAVGSPFCSG